jgi:putative ABC transport system permease protein
MLRTISPCSARKMFYQRSPKCSNLLTTFLSAIAGISLLVGGIGIMNVMLVAVGERTREIGIRKAVGATYGDVMEQFVIEALVISCTGGALGLLLGIASSSALGSMLGLRTIIRLEHVVLAIGVSSLVGVFFGIYPARRAARLNPADALRHE